MPRVLRHILVCLGAIVVIALQANGVLSGQHQVEHALQSPATAYQADIGHDHHAGTADHAGTPDLDAVETGEQDDDGPIKHHHHHSGGDVHVALAADGYATDDPPTGSARLGATPGLLPRGLTADEPSDPPKQTRA